MNISTTTIPLYLEFKIDIFQFSGKSLVCSPNKLGFWISWISWIFGCLKTGLHSRDLDTQKCCHSAMHCNDRHYSVCFLPECHWCNEYSEETPAMISWLFLCPSQICKFGKQNRLEILSPRGCLLTLRVKWQLMPCLDQTRCQSLFSSSVTRNPWRLLKIITFLQLQSQ